jgi:hypothetical protein
VRMKKTEKHCPFCFGPAVPEATEGKAFYYFRCYWCGCRGAYCKTIDEARTAWNLRTKNALARLKYFIHKNFVELVWRVTRKP